LVEITTVYFVFPETYNRTLEELSFMFEDMDTQKKAESRITKQLHEVEQIEEAKQMEAKRNV